MTQSAVTDFVNGVLFRNWGTKITAVILALVVFLVTREEIHRTFQLPLRVVVDPDRVLLTEVPNSVSVEIRGPWQRLNRLGNHELGAATLDLQQAKAGPLQIDPASIVMPNGVILERIDYDPVDLRFEPVLERTLPVIPRMVGEVSADYELVSVEVEPQNWRVRGGKSAVAGLAELTTTTVNLAGAMQTVENQVDLVRPSGEVKFANVPDGVTPRVTVRARLQARSGSVEVTVRVLEKLKAVVPELDPQRDKLPTSEKVRIKGKQSALRELEGIAQPVVPNIDVERGDEKIAIELRFGWAEEVPASVRSSLSLEPSLVRFSVERDQEL
jgi:YbbR domain-containing protein